MVNLAYSILMAHGMTTDIYNRENCIARFFYNTTACNKSEGTNVELSSA